MQSQICVILFDFGNVLAQDQSRKMLAKRSGKTVKEINEILEKAGSQDCEVGRMKEEEFWDKVAKFLEISKEELEEIKSSCFKINKNLLNLIIELRKRGYGVGLITNHFSNWLASYGKHFNHIFHQVVCSAEVGYRKPEIPIFQAACQSFYALPENTLLIDDKQSIIEIAKSIGMSVILYENFPKLLEDLKQWKIL